MDGLPTYNLSFSNNYMHTLLLSIIAIRCFCTTIGETEHPRPSLSIIDNNKKTQTLGPVKTQKEF